MDKKFKNIFGIFTFPLESGFVLQWLGLLGWLMWPGAGRQGRAGRGRGHHGDRGAPGPCAMTVGRPCWTPRPSAVDNTINISCCEIRIIFEVITAFKINAYSAHIIYHNL